MEKEEAKNDTDWNRLDSIGSTVKKKSKNAGGRWKEAVIIKSDGLTTIMIMIMTVQFVGK